MSHTPSDAITTDSKINRDATSARALAALAGSCFMEERLTYFLTYIQLSKIAQPIKLKPVLGGRY
jgi:hypothetical protein